MSSSLPIIENHSDAVAPEHGEVAERDPAHFLAQLLDEQQTLTPVEQFSLIHDRSQTADETQASPAQERYYRELIPSAQPDVNQQYAFEVDMDACSGCKACVVACHTLNGLDEHESFRRVGSIQQISADAPSEVPKYVTTACHHCEDPGCLNGCPVLAYTKDEQTGIVQHHDDQCIGCKYCTMMCPYEVPVYNERLGIVRKCDMCTQRLSVGEAPACVQACPNQAISIRVVERGQSFAADDRLVVGAPRSEITLPTTRFVQQAGTTTQSSAMVDVPAESHWPLAALLVASQASVGLLLVSTLATAVGMVRFDSNQWLIVHVVSLLLALAGMAISPMHLGQPTRAWRIFLGLRRSWLSREGVLLGAYVGLLLVSTLGQAYVVVNGRASSVLTETIHSATRLAAAPLLFLGIAAAASSAMIYVATRRELWSLQRTSVFFGGSIVVLGSAWGCVAASAISSQELFGPCLLAAILLLGKQRWEWRNLLGAEQQDDTDFVRRARMLVAEQLDTSRQRRIGFGIAATVLLLFAGLTSLPVARVGAGASLTCVLTVGAAILATAGEYFERILYFQSVVFDRMPEVPR